MSQDKNKSLFAIEKVKRFPAFNTTSVHKSLCEMPHVVINRRRLIFTHRTPYNSLIGGVPNVESFHNL